MKATIYIATLLCVAAAPMALADNRVGDFALLDSHGEFHRMSYYDNHKAVAFMVFGGDEKSADESIAVFEKLQAKHKDRIKFFLLDPDVSDSRKRVRERLEDLKTNLRVLMDDSQLVSQALGISRFGETVVIDTKSFEIVYRGAHGKLTAAIEQILAAQPMAKPWAAATGKKILYARELVSELPLSYAKDIAPILAENCARCHREGGIGPFAMTSHAVVKGFAPMIREVVLTKRMPPGQVDPHVGNIKNTNTLTATQQRKLIAWIDAGAKKVGGADPLAELTWPKSKWALGEPDLVIKVPVQNIPATGVLPLVDVTVPIEGLDRDRYVRASEYLPSDRSVLHHSVTNVVLPQSAQASPMLAYASDGARIASYVPGTVPLVEPANTGGLLKKGSSLAMNLHYTTNGKTTSDAGEIGIWFYPEKQAPTDRMSVECACILSVGWKAIPPFDAQHEMKRSVTLPKDGILYSIAPHMHFRGKSMRFVAYYPDGSQEDLLNVANYQYNWQMSYELTEPKRLPAGTKLTAAAVFDNSTQNKANPDPARRVPAGEQSWDEMMVGAIALKYVDSIDTARAARTR